MSLRGVFMPEGPYCGSEFNVPKQQTIGQLICENTDHTFLRPDAIPHLLEVFPYPSEASADQSPWGPMIKLGAANRVDPHEEQEQDRVGIGNVYLDEKVSTPWGPGLVGHVGITCPSAHGVVRDPDVFGPVLPDGRNVPKHSRLFASPRAVNHPWGPPVTFIGYGHCDYRDRYEGARSPYYFDLFGKPCAVCPFMLMTAERPCFSGSYEFGEGPVCSDAHSNQRYDSCGDGYTAVGPAVCRPPEVFPKDYHEWCTFDEHHSEECSVQRSLGYLLNVLLTNSDVLTKIPMIPSTQDYTGGLTSACDYDCGEFGWQLAGPWVPIPENWMLPNWALRVQEIVGDCCTSPGVPCLEETGSKPGSFWRLPYVTCRPICTQELCVCSDAPPIACAGTHEFIWYNQAIPAFDLPNPPSSDNAITECYVCFKQRELCDPQIESCDSNPHPDALSYYNPSSSTIVDVEVKIVLKIKVLHFDPRFSCFCCLDQGAQPPPQIKTITLTGQWCGPIAFGHAFDVPFTGYPDDPPYPGHQFRDPPGPPSSTYPRSFCSNLFVNQGYHNDFADNPGKFGVVEPPKRCPSWLGGGGKFQHFWCPPWLTWDWRWDPPLRSAETGFVAQNNHHTRNNQCWNVEAITWNEDNPCQGGEANPDASAPEGYCTGAACRRGCSMTDDSIDGFTPCAGEKGYRFRATPWGCGQCQIPAPLPGAPLQGSVREIEPQKKGLINALLVPGRGQSRDKS